VTVDRPGVGTVGSSTGVVSGGDVAFEVNHPGGVCWGNGTALKVTPDIVPGDKVSISFGGVVAGDTTVGEAYVTEKAVVTGSTLTVTGHIGATVDPANTEQRIVNPDLRATAVARRDIMAVPGPLTPSANGSYQSSLEFLGTTFTATYVFLDPAVAQVANSSFLGERMMSWQVVDLAGNRQGLTIAERGEVGGPGVGGCPNGPLASGPPGPSNVVAVNVAGGVKLTWTPATAIPGTPAITGYRVHAVSQTVSATGEQVEFGKRIANPAATGTTITGLSATDFYNIEVVSVNSVGETFPPVVTQPVTDVVPPTVTATPPGGSYAVPQNVALSANEAGSQIYYTTDATDPVLADVLSATAIAYTGPIAVTADTTLRYAAFDPAGNVSLIGEQIYTITNTPVPATPTFTTTSVGAGSVTLNWADADPSITGYEVQIYDGAGTAKIGTPLATTATTLTISAPDVTADTPYQFTVLAKNANGSSPESSKVGPLTPLGAVIANAGPDQTVVRKTTASTVTLTGAGSTTVGATYLWEQVLASPTDPDKVTLTGATTLSPTFVLPLYTYPMTNNPLTFRLTVTTVDGSKADTVLVTPKPDTVALATAKWKAGDFRVTGGGSVVGATIKVHKGSLAGPVLGSTLVTAGPPPVFSLRQTNAAAPATNPLTIWIESTVGGVAGPFTVTAG
jgi:Chitobiase/beta-hexosaminidase C-terminal domain/Fibronectin type III domain